MLFLKDMWIGFRTKAEGGIRGTSNGLLYRYHIESTQKLRVISHKQYQGFSVSSQMDI